jgi:hypothetical protein
LKNPSGNDVIMPVKLTHPGTGSTDFPTTQRMTDDFRHLVLDEISLGSVTGQLFLQWFSNLVAFQPGFSQFFRKKSEFF